MRRALAGKRAVQIHRTLPVTRRGEKFGTPPGPHRRSIFFQGRSLRQVQRHLRRFVIEPPRVGGW